MITFRALPSQDFAAFSSYFIVDYARNLVANWGLAWKRALALVEDDLRNAFPTGPESPAAGHKLLSILDAQALAVGTLWVETQDAKTVFIRDFHIFQAFQGRGLAKAAMAAFDEAAARDGFAAIRLRVAPNNAAALHVYAASGFRICGVQMIKPLIS